MNWNELTMSEKTIEFPMFEGLTVPVQWLNVEFAPITVNLHDEIQVEPTWSEFVIYFDPKDPQSFQIYDNILNRKIEELFPRFTRQTTGGAELEWGYRFWCAGWVTEEEFLSIPKLFGYVDNIALKWRVRLVTRSKFSTGAAMPAAITLVPAPRRYGKIGQREVSKT